jgi:hypothetical protein
LFHIQLLLNEKIVQYSITSPLGGLKRYETNWVHPYSSRAFQSDQECNKRHCDLRDLKMTNKQNKLPFLHG